MMKPTTEILGAVSSCVEAQFVEAETFPQLEDLRREAYPPLDEVWREHRAMLEEMALCGKEL